MHESDLIYKVEIYSLYIGRKLKVEFEMEERVLIYRYRKMKVESEIEEVSLYIR